jgi:hypothetical protein
LAAYRRPRIAGKEETAYNAWYCKIFLSPFLGIRSASGANRQ